MHGIHVTGFVSNEACFRYDIKHGFQMSTWLYVLLHGFSTELASVLQLHTLLIYFNFRNKVLKKFFIKKKKKKKVVKTEMKRKSSKRSELLKLLQIKVCMDRRYEFLMSSDVPTFRDPWCLQLSSFIYSFLCKSCWIPLGLYYISMSLSINLATHHHPFHPPAW